MYGCDSSCAYSLQGVFRVHREPRDMIDSRGRTHTALAYRIRGSAHFFCEDGEYSAGTGSVVYIPAGYDYRIRYAEEDMIIVHLSCVGTPGLNIEIDEAGEDVKILFEELCRAWEMGGTAYYPRCMAILYRIFEAMEKNRLAGSELPAVIVPGVRALREGFRDPSLSVAAMADACHISEVYFRRLFRAHFGKSPMSMLLELRFDYAKNLLRSGYYQVKQVAQMAGFSDTKYFRTAFTRRFGISPSRFAGA